MTDQKRNPDCDENGTDNDERSLPGASDCEKDNADNEESCSGRPFSASHAPNVLKLSGERSGAERVRCSAVFGAAALQVCEELHAANSMSFQNVEDNVTSIWIFQDDVLFELPV